MDVSPFVNSKKTLAELELATGDYADARLALAEVEATGRLDDIVYADLMNVVIDMAENEVNFDEVTAGQEATIRNVASGTSSSATEAEILLEIIYGENTEHPIMKLPTLSAKWSGVVEGGDDGSSKEQVGSKSDRIVLEEFNGYFRLYPNPNNGQFTIEYDFGNSELKTFTLYGMLGRNMKSVRLNGNSNQLSLDGSDLKNGLYFYEVKMNGEVIYSDKLIIQK